MKNLRSFAGVVAVMSFAWCAVAHAGIAEVFAGCGQKGSGGDDGPAVQAKLDNPFGVVRGPDGCMYFCEFGGHVIRKVGAKGVISTIAGTGAAGYSGDGGPATKATLNQPHEIRFDKDGNLFVSDMVNHAIRKIDMKSGVMSTLAGTGKPGYSGDGGPASAAQMKSPISIQFDSHGDLFICDIGNHVIRRIEMKSGIMSTYAGTGKPGPTPDGSPISGTALQGPRSLDFDSAGNLWLATREGNQVLKFDLAAGKIIHIAGTGKKGFTGNDGPAKLATLNGPKGIAMAGDGCAYLADTESHAIRKIDPKSGNISVAVGTGARPAAGEESFSSDSFKCKLARPHGIYVDADGSLFVGDSENHRVLHIK